MYSVCEVYNAKAEDFVTCLLMHRKIEQNNISYSKTIQILHTKQLKGDIMLFPCFVNCSMYMYMDVTKHIKTQHIIM